MSDFYGIWEHNASFGISSTSELTFQRPSTPPPEPPPPEPPPPVQSRVWSQNINGDGSIVFTEPSVLVASIVGPNDSQVNGPSNGWSVIYSFFSEPTVLTFDYYYVTSDGIQYDYPIILESFSEPFNPVFPNFTSATRIANSNQEQGVYTFSSSGNTWVLIGVYSTDSCCGNGQLKVEGLPK